MLSEPGQKRFFLGRQPILDCNQEIVGYELLFRAADQEKAVFTNHDVATASVISSALAGFGFNDILGDKLGFFNINFELFYSELLEILPAGQTVLELLEFLELDDRAMARCLELKEKGFQISLDDHLYAQELSGIYSIIDIVKLDILEIPPGDLEPMVRSLRQFPVRLLAEKVETSDQFETCLVMGFDLFQGYFFQRPEVLKRKCLEIPQLEMLQLLDSLTRESDIGNIEERFRHSPTLSFHLLKLVNSVNTGLRVKIHSLRHAITLLGIDNLRRWVQLALFATADNRGLKNPLLEMAAVRGRFMEQMIMGRHQLPRGDDLVAAAFMSGIFSLLDVLFETSMEVIVSGLSLRDDVSDALLKRDGEMGMLLSLAEILEQANFGAVEELLNVNDITVEEMIDAQLSAYNWRNSVTV